MRHTLSMMIEPINWTLSAASTLARFWAGWRGRPAHAAPDRPIILYEIEGCPFCRVAREAVSALQLSADVRPCPRGGVRFRPELVKTGGKAQFPYMIDPNTGAQMYESADIARYLYKTYGKRSPPPWLWPIVRNLNALWSALSLLPRLHNGRVSYGREHAIAEPLEFWGVEADPCVRLVRETLCSLEVPYRLHTRASRDGAQLTLFDPATGARHTSSFSARRYLLKHYG